MATECGEHDGFRYEILNSNSTTAVLKVFIPAGKSIRAIPGCMFATSCNVEITGKWKRGWRATFGIDDSRIQILSVPEESESEGWALLTPGFYGSISTIMVNQGDELCVGDNAFLACLGDGIESTVKSQPVKQSFMSGSGMFIKKIKAPETGGVVFVCAVGTMMLFNLKEKESMVVENGHLVTWPNHMEYVMQKAGKNWYRSGLSGQGIVSKLTGPGTIRVQTRNPKEMADWVYDTKSPS